MHAQDDDPSVGSQLFASWVLEKSRSDSIGDIMKVAGAPWIARSMASMATPTVVIAPTDAPHELSITTHTLFRTVTIVLKTDKSESEASAYGEGSKQHGYW
eukprot:CAMPEP_0174257748 /NCGR_PEP_ID=MMETSP0439-20130205/6866_1 /TAXON_ID=0 /ORGANISM="Stereomyxa ramosa, Strain Chinc5" /LENGTH=100 /DNA_ID=CAMNT_0015340985 /DNA_START=25 /DNA_END=324 /DNA_ORIENTATION=+